MALPDAGGPGPGPQSGPEYIGRAESLSYSSWMSKHVIIGFAGSSSLCMCLSNSSSLCFTGGFLQDGWRTKRTITTVSWAKQLLAELELI